MEPVVLSSADVAALADSLNYALPTNETTLKALGIANALQDWLDECCTGGTTPLAMATIGQHVLQVSIGNELVWDSESNSDDELSVEWIKQAWRLELQALLTAFDPAE